jgi:hypothetical protein
MRERIDAIAADDSTMIITGVAIKASSCWRARCRPSTGRAIARSPPISYGRAEGRRGRSARTPPLQARFLKRARPKHIPAVNVGDRQFERSQT